MIENRWNEWREKHEGETGLVIGNGPSLSGVPLDFLQKYPSFGANRIYLLDGFEPTYYVAVNPLVIEQFNYEMEKLTCPMFIAEFYTRHVLTDAIPLVSSNIPGFSREPDRWVYEGYTVTYVSLQIAYFMGFRTVLLVGVDHKYDYAGLPNREVLAEGKDVNHFHPDYFADGTKWHNPDLFRSRLSYQMAKTVYENEGRKIVNLTPKSGLKVFEMGDIGEW